MIRKVKNAVILVAVTAASVILAPVLGIVAAIACAIGLKDKVDMSDPTWRP